MAQKAAAAGTKKVQIDLLSMLLLGVLAGIFIALAANFYTVTMTESAEVPAGLARLLGGLTFCLGLVLVVIAGAELFTGNTLIVMAVLCRRVALRFLLRSWLVVYVGNFIGSVLVAGMVWGAGQDGLAGGATGELAVRIAEAKCALPFWQAFWRGVLCNMLVCWAIWMCFAGKSATDKILAVLLPIAAFVAGGFEHCVANMYFVPMGLFLKASAGSGPAGLTWGNFLLRNLLPVTLGNIVGGAILVGGLLWVIYYRFDHEPRYRERML